MNGRSRGRSRPCGPPCQLIVGRSSRPWAVGCGPAIRRPEAAPDVSNAGREAFARTLAELRPTVVHVQELAGLPSSLLDVARGSRVPVVMTLHDYFLLCSTFKLLDLEGRVCLRREIGADCVATVAADPRPPDLLGAEVPFHRHLDRRVPLQLQSDYRRHHTVQRVLWTCIRTPEPDHADPQHPRRHRAGGRGAGHLHRVPGPDGRNAGAAATGRPG